MCSVKIIKCDFKVSHFVSQMYSGTFTHYITPVLSTAQIENLFNLLGYELSASSSEQLHLQTHRVNSTSSDTLLCLSCAFFLARCECHFLTTALGKHCGDTQWELSAVMERQRGNCLQVCDADAEIFCFVFFQPWCSQSLHCLPQASCF